MRVLFHAMLPEIILIAFAGVLFLLGVSNKAASRRLAPVLAIVALVLAGLSQFGIFGGGGPQLSDHWGTVHVFEFARYVKILSSVMGVLLVLLAWPSNADATGGPAMNFGTEAGEFFGLMLLSIAGIFMVSGANDIMLLFLGIELASIPTYIMVSISRPLSVAQEAGVKYFFLGAMAAAIMLFGFSYLYGTTGTTKLIGTPAEPGIAEILAVQMGRYNTLTTWQMLAVVMLIAGFAFKMAAVPLHVYAGDVYQGAATPVTAFLSFVPKISGFVALLKVLYAVSGGEWHVQEQIVKLLCALAILTMTFGNVLGLLQFNIKRVMAYSSIAHTGYMLVGVTALVATTQPDVQRLALQGILFYLTAYGLMNIGVFGVLLALPSRGGQPATSAETFEDLAGLGHKHLTLGLAMAVSCFSLIGIPLTVGFFGKFYLIAPALKAGLVWTVAILVANAAISAVYYLKIVAAMFLRPEPAAMGGMPQSSSRPVHHPVPVLIAIGVSVVAVLWFGIVLPSTQTLTIRMEQAAQLEQPYAHPVASAIAK